MVEMILESNSGDEFDLRVGVGEQSVTLKCERHCRVYFLVYIYACVNRRIAALYIDGLSRGGLQRPFDFSKKGV